jgi:hypothetical protein
MRILLAILRVLFGCQNKQNSNPSTSSISIDSNKANIIQDSANRPFQIKVSNASEIRMGSPYNTCSIELIGFNKVELPKNGWQDKYAWNEKSDHLVLIKWSFENNNPGYALYLINISEGKIQQSPRFQGLLNDVMLNGKKAKINKFVYNNAPPVDGKLCCNVEEDYEFK